MKRILIWCGLANNIEDAKVVKQLRGEIAELKAENESLQEARRGGEYRIQSLLNVIEKLKVDVEASRARAERAEASLVVLKRGL